jgi:hypothetical protein
MPLTNASSFQTRARKSLQKLVLPVVALLLLLPPRNLPSLFSQTNLSSNKRQLLPHPNLLTPQISPTLLLSPHSQRHPRHNPKSALRLLFRPPHLQPSSLLLNPLDSPHHPHQLLFLIM